MQRTVKFVVGMQFTLSGCLAVKALKSRVSSLVEQSAFWLVLLLAFTAFSRRANIEAHVGGFAAGMLLGPLAPRLPMAIVFQWGAAVAVAGVVGACWWLAW